MANCRILAIGWRARTLFSLAFERNGGSARELNDLKIARNNAIPEPSGAKRGQLPVQPLGGRIEMKARLLDRRSIVVRPHR